MSSSSRPRDSMPEAGSQQLHLLSYIKSLSAQSPPPLEEPENVSSEGTPIQWLQQACRYAFDILLKDPAITQDELKEQEGRYSLWSGDFTGSKTGSLDHQLVGNGRDNLRDAICIALISLSQPQLQLLKGRISESCPKAQVNTF